MTIRLTAEDQVVLHLAVIRLEQAFALVVPGRTYPADDDSGLIHMDVEVLF